MSSPYSCPLAESKEELVIMAMIDEIHLRYPFSGSLRIQDELTDNGFHISRDRVRGFMREMDVKALSRKQRLSKRHPAHKIYAYLLSGLKIDK